VKILMLQEVLTGRWPSHGIGPYGPCTICGYKTERHPLVFSSELHYHYHHYCFFIMSSTSLTAAEHKAALLDACQERDQIEQEVKEAEEEELLKELVREVGASERGGKKRERRGGMESKRGGGEAKM
jgi:hypothetical protein